jgi:hypothetical protein
MLLTIMLLMRLVNWGVEVEARCLHGTGDLVRMLAVLLAAAVLTRHHTANREPPEYEEDPLSNVQVLGLSS